MFLAPKEARRFDSFLDAHPLASVITTSDTARSQFPIIMAFVPEPVKSRGCFIAAHRSKREEERPGPVVFLSSMLYRGADFSAVVVNLFQ